MTLSETKDGDVEVAGTTRWDSGAFTFIRPRYAGVTSDGVMWLGYVSYRNAIFVWLSPDGRVYNQAQTQPSFRAARSSAWMVIRQPISVAPYVMGRTGAML